jgi:hypothetical protein
MVGSVMVYAFQDEFDVGLDLTKWEVLYSEDVAISTEAGKLKVTMLASEGGRGLICRTIKKFTMITSQGASLEASFLYGSGFGLVISNEKISDLPDLKNGYMIYKDHYNATLSVAKKVNGTTNPLGFLGGVTEEVGVIKLDISADKKIEIYFNDKKIVTDTYDLPSPENYIIFIVSVAAPPVNKPVGYIDYVRLWAGEWVPTATVQQMVMLLATILPLIMVIMFMRQIIEALRS